MKEITPHIQMFRMQQETCIESPNDNTNEKNTDIVGDLQQIQADQVHNSWLAISRIV